MRQFTASRMKMGNKILYKLKGLERKGWKVSKKRVAVLKTRVKNIDS